MTESESKKIASLTTGAIRTTGASTIKSMLATVEAAEAKISDLQDMVDVAAKKTEEVRAIVERFADDFTRATGTLANNVSEHVKACQDVIDLFQDHHLKILNVDAKTAEVPPGNGRNFDRLVEEIKTLHPQEVR